MKAQSLASTGSISSRPQGKISNGANAVAKNSLAKTTIISRLSATNPTNSDNYTAFNKFNYNFYMSLVDEGGVAKQLVLSSPEKDISTHLRNCQASLQRDIDWQVRMKTLLSLQGIVRCVADTCSQYVDELIYQLKSIHEVTITE